MRHFGVGAFWFSGPASISADEECAASILQNYRVVGRFVWLGADSQNADISIAAPSLPVIFGDHDPVAVPENGAFLQFEGVLVPKGWVYQRMDRLVQTLDRQVSCPIERGENLDIRPGQIPLYGLIPNGGLDIFFCKLYQLETVVKDQVGSTGESRKPSGIMNKTDSIFGLTMSRFQCDTGDTK